MFANRQIQRLTLQRIVGKIAVYRADMGNYRFLVCYCGKLAESFFVTFSAFGEDIPIIRR